MGGGKSRKSGGVSKRLIQRLKAMKEGKVLNDARPKTAPLTDYFQMGNEPAYKQVEQMRRDRVYSFRADNVDGVLGNIVEEVNVRFQIMKVEIFSIGELLYEARPLVKGSFKAWVEENFDFGYDTATNLIHVYECCGGSRRMLEGVKPSILYKISEPSFPEQLRTYLFSNDGEGLKQMTNRDVTDLVKRYKAQGWEGVSDEFKRDTEYHAFYNEVGYAMNLVDRICRDLELKRSQLERYVGGFRANEVMTKRADSTRILNQVHGGIEGAVQLLDAVRGECEKLVAGFKRWGCSEDDTATAPPAPVGNFRKRKISAKG